MYYFVTKLYRSLKFVFASLGLAGSAIAIIYGSIQTGGTIYIIGGSICLANSLFNFWEVGKVSADILKQINNLKKSLESFDKKLEVFANKNIQLENSVEQLERIKEDFIEKEKSLQKSLNRSFEQIEKMENLKNKYMSLSKDLEKNLEKENEQIISLTNKNKDLQANLEQVYRIKEEFQQENEEYQTLLKQARQQIMESEKIIQQFKDENKTLSINSKLQQEQIKEQQELIQDSKQLILDLSKFGDRYNQFADTIGTNVIKLEDTQEDLSNTASILKTLMEKLRNQTFQNLDQNQDGTITEAEFNQGLNR